jgi:transcriptional accessory protein Tex/SPT6
MYSPFDYPKPLRDIYNEILKTLVNDVFLKELAKEIKDEMKEKAENFVIERCQEQYKNFLMTGPF